MAAGIRAGAGGKSIVVCVEQHSGASHDIARTEREQVPGGGECPRRVIQVPGIDQHTPVIGSQHSRLSHRQGGAAPLRGIRATACIVVGVNRRVESRSVLQTGESPVEGNSRICPDIGAARAGGETDPVARGSGNFVPRDHQRTRRLAQAVEFWRRNNRRCRIQAANRHRRPKTGAPTIPGGQAIIIGRPSHGPVIRQRVGGGPESLRHTIPVKEGSCAPVECVARRPFNRRPVQRCSSGCPDQGWPLRRRRRIITIRQVCINNVKLDGSLRQGDGCFARQNGVGLLDENILCIPVRCRRITTQMVKSAWPCWIAREHEGHRSRTIPPIHTIMHTSQLP